MLRSVSGKTFERTDSSLIGFNFWISARVRSAGSGDRSFLQKIGVKSPAFPHAFRALRRYVSRFQALHIRCMFKMLSVKNTKNHSPSTFSKSQRENFRNPQAS